MVRTELREHIFKMLFQIEFNDSVDMPENLNYYFETLEDAKEKDKQYIQNKYEAILSHIEEIDGLLNENATGWKTTRMNKVDLSILRLALYEIKWDEENMFTQDFMLNRIYVKGEISNCKYHPSGHIYFSLKDESGTIACVMFAGSRAGLSFTLKNGQRVIAFGSVSVYERDGKYQLYAREIKLDGAGELYEKFEALKRELCEMGMFSDEYKQRIPAYVKTVGIVTAQNGAAVRDIINVAKRRNPYVQLILYPALVECSVPVISAVGHETDVTIADFVADLRAPTPSAAAELAVYEIRECKKTMSAYEDRIVRAALSQIGLFRTKAERFSMRLKLLHPRHKLYEHRQFTAEMENR